MILMEMILWFLLGFITTEILSAAIHKYLMHGVLWKIHRSHHVKTKGIFELNDVFTVLFGGTAVVLMLLGKEAFDYRFWIGSGISFYGLLYFIFHDVMIHKRMQGIKKPGNKYLRAIFEAHQAHHKSKEKHDAVSFGLFIVPKRFLNKQED